MSAVEQRSGAIDVGGRRLAWRSIGSGPPLVLVNGYAATAADWDPTLLAALASSCEAICPDNRGMGDSGPGDLTGLTIDAMADDVLALLDARGIGAAPVVGWSMGGFVAQRLTARAPARVARLALLGTDPGGPGAVRADPATWAALLDRSGSPREQATRLLGLIFPAGVAEQIDAQFGDLVAQARAALSPPVLDAQERAMDAWHARPPEPLPDSTPPVLVVHGAEDVVIPAANADLLAARWPHARVERFAGCGHALMAQEPQRLAELVAGFVRG